MRALLASLLALMLTGCSLVTAPTSGTPQTPSAASSRLPANGAAVKVYSKAAELLDKPFRDLGEVSGDSCQLTMQDPPPSIPVARRRMQISAAKLQANAVLQHRCELISGTPGCYRQAVCTGSALNVQP